MDTEQCMGNRAVRILVVCTGNLCRSPLAAELLRVRLAPTGADVDVRSAGTDAELNDRSPLAMIDAGLLVGADLGGHRSAMISRALLAGADLVLAATVGHCREVLALSDGAADRTFTYVEAGRLAAEVADHDRAAELEFLAWRAEMGALRSPAAYWQRRTHPDDIADPYGGPTRGYEAVAWAISSAVDKFVEAWTGGPVPIVTAGR